MFAPGADSVEAFDRWLAAHDAEVRAEAQSDPAEDERLVRYMAMATPLGYQAALSVVQQMTLMIQAETEARRAGVVTEEPEWEYSWAGTDDEGDDWVMDDAFDTRGAAETYVTRPIGRWVNTDNGTLVRRRKAGPWVPVKQEGAETDA
ncbi:hypothetical protein NS234_01850 [Microbacterium oxydans]|nr:hypothetical protein NS234_01850 [Microbacterium oxydans]